LGRDYLSTLSASDGRMTDEWRVFRRRQDGLIEVLSQNKKTHPGKLCKQPNRFV
jgi:hypothetical protein